MILLFTNFTTTPVTEKLLDSKKYVVYMDNQFCLLKREYFSEKKGIIIGYHNPMMATWFYSKKEAKAFQNKIAMETKISSFQKEYDRFTKTTWEYRKITPINDKLNIPYKGEDKYKVLEWWKATKALPESSIKYEVYKTWPKLSSVFTHLWDYQGYHSLEDRSKTYHSYSIRTSKTGNINEFKKELELVLDDITYVSEEGYKLLSVFEHNLGAGGSSYSFCYKSEKDCKIVGNYGREIRKGSLTKCFDYLKQELWYE